MKITNREKKLLIGVIILLAVVVGFMFVVSPMWSSIKNEKAYLDELKVKEEEVNEAIDSYDAINSNIAKKASDVAKKSEYIFARGSNMLIDTYIQTFAGGAKITQLQIGNYSEDASYLIATVTVSGSVAEINGVLQRINANTRSIKVDSFSLGSNTAAEATAQINLRIYVVDKGAISG